MTAAPATVGASARRSQPSRSRRILLYQTLLVFALFAIWEVLVRTKVLPVYLYGQPSGILAKARQLAVEGDLITHVAATAFASIVGFVLGTALGSLAGLLMWLSKTAALVLRPVIVAINGVPKIALAPLIVVWVGVGLGAKVAIAASLTFIVALISVYQGTQEVDEDLVKLMRSLGAKPFTIWKKVIVPGATPWILSTMRLNIGFAMIGAVVGEYISSKMGLGYMIYNAGALYDLNSVFVGIFCLMALALMLDAVLGRIEERFKW
ncbi:MAG: ABC transporter permease [Beijerinckiaceae bacterium]